MLLTKKEDFDALRIESGMTWSSIGESMGKTRSGATSATRNVKNYVAKSYVNIVEAMGYDIKLRFIKR